MAMLKLLDENRDRLCDALQQDLHKVCIYSGCLYIQWMFVYTVDVCIYSGCLFLYTHTVNKKGHQTVSQAVSQSIYKAA